MLGIWEDAQAVAFFATAQRTAMLTSFILFAVNTIAAPKFAAMHAANDMQGVRRMAIMSVRMMLLVAVPTTLFIFLLPEWLMSMFGEGFSAAATALMILAAGQFVNIATGSVGYLLSMTGLEKKVRDNVLISGAVSVLLGLILIPIYGVIGAAVAYACGVASQNLLGVYQVKKHLGFNTLCFWREA
jgi:O-antigen/teichoic acid export membrane protein